jgi:hypothetical protein
MMSWVIVIESDGISVVGLSAGRPFRERSAATLVAERIERDLGAFAGRVFVRPIEAEDD